MYNKGDEVFNKNIYEVIKKYSNGKIPKGTSISVTFSNDDLKYSIHKIDFNIEGEMDNNGIWNIKISGQDTYDFGPSQMAPNKNSEHLYSNFGIIELINDIGWVGEVSEFLSTYRLFFNFNISGTMNSFYDKINQEDN